MEKSRIYGNFAASFLLVCCVLASCSRVPSPRNSQFEFEFQLKGILVAMKSFQKAYNRLPQNDAASGISWRAECMTQLHPITGSVDPNSGNVALTEQDKRYGEVLFRHHSWQVSANLQFLEGRARSQDPVLAFVPTPSTAWWQIENRNCQTSNVESALVLYDDGSSRIVKLNELIPLFFDAVVYTKGSG